MSVVSVDDLEDVDLLAADEEELISGIGNEDVQSGNADVNIASVPVQPPKKRVVRNPQPKLDHQRLKGPRGIGILESCFKDIKFKGKGHEREDLDNVMCTLEQWTHRLFPKFTFDDALSRIEKLGHKSQVKTYVKKIRMGLEDEDTINLDAVNVIENLDGSTELIEIDPFDALLQEKSSSTPVVIQQETTLTAEQRERMLRNRLLAEERRMARMMAQRQEEMAAECVLSNKEKQKQIENEIINLPAEEINDTITES